MREWATRELRGYGPDDPTPDYRTRGVILSIDGVSGNAIIRNQQISPMDLPDFAQDSIGEELTFQQGVGELEAMIPEGESTVRLKFPMASKLAQWMSAELETPFQQVTSIYWVVSRATIEGILDQVRTSLAELIGELRAGLGGRSHDVPTADLADRAVNIIMQDGGRIAFNEVAAGDGASTVITTGDASEIAAASSNSASHDALSNADVRTARNLRDRISAWSLTKKLTVALATVLTLVTGLAFLLERLPPAATS